MRLLAVVFLGLTGCAPTPGQPGYAACDPVEPKAGCLLWVCFEVQDDGRVRRWVDGENGDFQVCQGPDCAAELETAAERAGCPLDLESCRDDCDVVCGGGRVPCGDTCELPADCEPGTPAGGACSSYEACS